MSRVSLGAQVAPQPQPQPQQAAGAAGARESVTQGDDAAALGLLELFNKPAAEDEAQRAERERKRQLERRFGAFQASAAVEMQEVQLPGVVHPPVSVPGESDGVPLRPRAIFVRPFAASQPRSPPAAAVASPFAQHMPTANETGGQGTGGGDDGEDATRAAGPREVDFMEVVDEDETQAYEDYVSEVLCAKFIESIHFRTFILVAIMCNTVLVGLRTSAALERRHVAAFEAIDSFFLAVFVLEILIKWFHGFWSFWKVGWNIFDFTLVLISVFGDGLSFLRTGRLLRIFRVLRAFRSLRSITALRSLQVLVQIIVRSIPDVINIIALLAIVNFIFGVVAIDLFGKEFPEHFGSMDRVYYTLFVAMTQDGWVSIYEELEAGGKGLPAALYFVVYIVIGALIFANIIVGVTVTNLQLAYKEDNAFSTQAVKHRSLDGSAASGGGGGGGSGGGGGGDDKSASRRGDDMLSVRSGDAHSATGSQSHISGNSSIAPKGSASNFSATHSASATKSSRGAGEGVGATGAAGVENEADSLSIDRVHDSVWRAQKPVHLPGGEGASLEALHNYYLVLIAVEDNLKEQQELKKRLLEVLGKVKRFNQAPEAEGSDEESDEDLAADGAPDVLTQMMRLEKKKQKKQRKQEEKKEEAARANLLRRVSGSGNGVVGSGNNSDSRSGSGRKLDQMLLELAAQRSPNAPRLDPPSIDGDDGTASAPPPPLRRAATLDKKSMNASQTRREASFPLPPKLRGAVGTESRRRREQPDDAKHEHKEEAVEEMSWVESVSGNESYSDYDADDIDASDSQPAPAPNLAKAAKPAASSPKQTHSSPRAAPAQRTPTMRVRRGSK